MEKLTNFFMMFCIVAMIIILAAIAWGMWRPVLIDQQNMRMIVQTLQNHEQAIKRIGVDIDLLKRQPIKPAEGP